MAGKVNEVMSIYQYVLKGASPGPNDLRNIHHYEFPGYVPSTAEAEEVAQGIADRIETDLLALIANDITLQGFDIRRVDLGDLPTLEYVPTGWPITGGATGNMLPPQVSALVTWKAETAFPRSTRTYLFPFADGQSSGTGTIILAARTAMAAWAVTMESIEVTGQVDASKVAVQYGGTPRAVVDWNPVSATPIGSVYATQRSRRYGVGS